MARKSNTPAIAMTGRPIPPELVPPTETILKRLGEVTRESIILRSLLRVAKLRDKRQQQFQ